MSPDESQSFLIIIAIINWVFGIISVLAVAGIIFGPIITIIMAIIEGSKEVAAGQKRSWKKTKIAGITYGVCFGVLIVVLVLWGVAVYGTSNLLGSY